MNLKISYLLLTLCLSIFSLPSHAASGQLKPYSGNLSQTDINLPDMQGNRHSLQDYRGNIVLVQFWATYCSPCRKEMPTMNSLIKKMKGKPFKIVSVNMAETPEEVAAFIKQVPVDFPVLLDSDGSTVGEWKVFAAPANFILDKKGNIIFTLFGAIDWDSEDMVNKLTLLTEM
jgi:thiol-disulfide isomerase/thioredoxin